MNETTQTATSPTPDDARAKFEAARLTRRQALAKFGLQFGATAIAALSVDDLVRAAGQALQQRANGNREIEQVARELQRAGVANATTVVDPSPCDGCGACVETDEIECEDCDASCSPDGSGNKKKPKPKPSAACKKCRTDFKNDVDFCTRRLNDCYDAHRDVLDCINEKRMCDDKALADCVACKARNSCPAGFSCQ